MLNDIIDIHGINYDLSQFHNLKYVLKKMSEYINVAGFTKAVRSQKLIRHLHLCIGIKLNQELKIPSENIHFEVKLKTKNIDIGIIEDNQLKVAISIRSQSSSIKKNFTNNVNGLQGEVVSIKSLYPNTKTGVVYLFKENDIDTGDNCIDYYNNNIPKKLIPIISNSYISSRDHFDTGCFIIWDYDDKNGLKLENSHYITKTFSLENFMKDIADLYIETKLKSQFTVSDLDTNKLASFLKKN